MHVVVVDVPCIKLMIASGLIVIDPNVVALAQSPSARIVNVNVPVSVGVPDIV